MIANGVREGTITEDLEGLRQRWPATQTSTSKEAWRLRALDVKVIIQPAPSNSGILVRSVADHPGLSETAYVNAWGKAVDHLYVLPNDSLLGS